MKRILGIVLLLLPMVAVAQNAIEGTWRVDLTKAQLDTKPMVVELNNGTYTCTSCDPKITVKANGQDQKVTGSPYIDTLSVKVVGPNEIERIAKKDGQVRSDDKLTISADGQTLTEVHDGKLERADGELDGHVRARQPAGDGSPWNIRSVED